jgi:SH3 domain protein
LFVIRIVLLLLSLFAAGQALGETRYITDQTEITLRRGESTRYKIVQMLPSGTPVEVLSTNSGTGYARVRTRDGTEGYVLARQLLLEPIARDRIAAMEEKLAELQQAPDQLAAQLTELKTAHEKLNIDFEDLQRQKEQLEAELATIRHASANVVQITQERTELRKAATDLTRQLAGLQQENADLKNQATHRWFLIGAGVVVLGIVIGLILPHLRFRRRRSSWGSL